MSSNLAKSGCCGVQVLLGDLVGKPIEFRRTGRYAPEMGTKWTCPKCGRDYFAFWRRRDEFWGRDLIDQADQPVIRHLFGVTRENEFQGRFYVEHPDGLRSDTGCIEIDLAFYENCRDEPGVELAEDMKPGGWCEDASDVQIFGDTDIEEPKWPRPRGDSIAEPKKAGRVDKLREETG